MSTRTPSDTERWRRRAAGIVQASRHPRRGRFECASLLASPPGDGTQQALASLDARLGTFPSKSAAADGCTETDWIEALLRFAPIVQRHHLCPWHPAGSLRRDPGRRGTEPSHQPKGPGTFGLDTWAWLTLHMAGNMFRFGRLSVPPDPWRGRRPRGSTARGCLGCTSQKTAASPPHSLTQASPRHGTSLTDIPGQGGRPGELRLVDARPLPARRLPASNIASFARRFTLERCSDARTTLCTSLSGSEAWTTLIASPARRPSAHGTGKDRRRRTWQLGHGHLVLPPAQVNHA